MTGIDGQAAAFLSYRKQWMGIQGAPVLSNFSFQAPGRKRIAIGLHASSESAGLLKSTGFRFSSGYNLPAGDGRYIRFGMSAGVSWNRVDVAGLQFGSPDPDPVVGSLVRSSTGILASAGASYHTKAFHFGISAPAMFEPDYLAQDAFTKGRFRPLGQMIIHGAYRMYINDGQSVIESFLNYRINRALPAQLELAAIGRMNGKFWAGASWKQGSGISGLAGFNLSKSFAVGYSYTLKNAGMGELGVPSHEIQLGILFGQRFKGNPVYSFINSVKDPRTVRKPGMVASANRKPAAKGYVPLQKGAVIAKTGPQKPLPPKPAATSKLQQQKPSTGGAVVTKAPSVTPPVTKPEIRETPVVPPSEAKQETIPPVAKPVPESKPVVAKVQEPVKPIANPTAVEKQPATVIEQKVATIPEQEKKPVIQEQPAVQAVKKPAVQAQPAVQAEKKDVIPEQPAVQAEKKPAISAQPTVQAEKKPSQAPDKSQGRPRLVQAEGLFDDQLPGETPAKPDKPSVGKDEEAEEGEDVAGLHGTRHVQDSLQEADEQERLSRLTLHNDDPKAAHEGEAPHAERHEFVRRGGHQSELSVGDYVIVGVFKTEVNARRWADGLKAMGFKDIDYGFLTERTVWYVHFAGIDDLEEARAVRNQYRKLKVFRDAWLLTVQE